MKDNKEIQTVDKNVLRNLKKLFTSRENNLINQGHEVLRSLADADVCNYFLDGVKYTPQDDIGLIPNSMFTGTGPAQPYLNSALIGVIAYAPEDCEIAVNLKKSINYLDIVLSFTDPLAEFENLEKLYLTGSEELENLVGLASLKKLKHINLKDCKALRKADEIQGCESLETLSIADCNNLTSLKLNGCKSLETLSIADCIGLTSLKLNGLTQLNLVDLSQTIDKPQWYLQVLELKHLPSLKELSLLGQSASYHYAGVYYQFIELEELVLDSLEVLESVDISWAYPLTKLFISNCPSVDSLKREDLYLSDRNHETVDLRIKNLPKINYLCLNNLKFTSTKNICDLKTLEKLDMENCTELKDLKGIGGMTLLKNLNLTGCTSLLNLTGLEKSKSLNIITAKKCSNLTDPSAIRGLNNLVSVDFNGCKKLLPMPQTKLLGGRPDIEDYQIKLFVSLGEKAPRGLNPINPAAKKLLNENFSKMKKLIRSYRLEMINQGVELMITINSPQIFEKFLFGTQVGDDGSLCAGPLFSAPKSSTEREYQQKNLNVGLLKLIQEAPEISIKNAGLNLADCSHLSLSKNANDWEYDDWDGISIGVYDIDYSTFQNLDFLDKFPNLTSLNLSGEALQNVDGLAKLTKLTSLDLRDCYSLQNIDGLANLTKLTNLNLSQCSELSVISEDKMTTRKQIIEYQDKIRLFYALRDGDAEELKNYLGHTSLDLSNFNTLQNVDGLANLTNLTGLDLRDCDALQNVDGLANLTNLTSLDLRDCDALQNVDGLTNLSKLTSLELGRCYALQNVDGLTNLSKLTSLELGDCYTLQNVDGLASLTNLTNLDLGGCDSIQNVDGLTNLSKLTSLRLSYCGSLKNIDGLSSLTNLTSLDLNSCKALKNVDGLASLTNLTSLDLSNGDALKNVDGLASLIKLTNLDLDGCETLQNVDGLANLTNLTSLKLNNCAVLKNIDSLDNCTNLTSLEMMGCCALKNIDSLANCTNLTSLNLAIHYTESSLLENVDSLANLTNLNSLYLEYCKSIKPKPSQWNMTTRKKVASYQERIKKGMK